jgi:hypothetical protein
MEVVLINGRNGTGSNLIASNKSIEYTFKKRGNICVALCLYRLSILDLTNILLQWSCPHGCNRVNFRAVDRNFARSRDGSEPMRFTDSNLRYDIIFHALKTSRSNRQSVVNPTPFMGSPVVIQHLSPGDPASRYL